MRSRYLILSALLAIPMLAPSVAGADTRPSHGKRSGAYVSTGNSATAVASDGGTGGGNPDQSGSGEPSACHWRVIIEDDSDFLVYDADSGQPRHSDTGRWLEYYCEGKGAIAVNGQFMTPEGERVDPGELAASAAATIDIPGISVGTSPDEADQLYVKVPTWLWVDSGWWKPYTATASAGRVTSTVTAKPIKVTWDMGDGTTETCHGPGTPWTTSSGATSECSYTYRHSSTGQPGGRYAAQVTVSFDVTWSSNIGAGGALPVITRQADLSLSVGEIQAIGTK